MDFPRRFEKHGKDEKKKWPAIFFEEFCSKVILEFGKKKIISTTNTSTTEAIKV